MNRGWKRVKLEGQLAEEPHLVAIECLSDYSVQTTKVGQSKKRIFSAKVQVGEAEEPQAKKPKKAKKAKKPKPAKGPEADLDDDEEATAPGPQADAPPEVDQAQMAAWHDLGVPEPILQALQAQGFHQPTPIQEAVLPAATLGRMDVVGAAETGSGKTLAFAIPIIKGILDSAEADEAPLKALILTPTRELAVQVKDHIERVTRFTPIKTVVIFGGMAAQKQNRVLSYGPEIVVATPGRLWDLVQEGHPHLSRLSEIKYLAIDETDRMLEKGHFEELHQLLEVMNSDEAMKAKRQNFIFSATLSMVHGKPQHIKEKKRKKDMTAEEKLQGLMDLIGVKDKRKVVDLTSKQGTASNVTESRITCAFSEKDIYLCYFLKKHPGRTLVFCNSIDCVRRLVNLFNILELMPLGLHAQMHQKQRLKNLERFTTVPGSVLMATDVAARGLDIPQVEHVIHYQVPKTAESYVHRSGRTARASNDGISVIIMEPSETFDYKKLCKTLSKEEDLPEFPVDRNTFRDWKEAVQVAREVDKLKLNLRKEDVSRKWWEKAAEEAELIVSDSDGDDDEKAQSRMQSQRDKTRIVTKRRELAEILVRLDSDVKTIGKYPTMLGPLSGLEGAEKKSALDALEEETILRKKVLGKKNPQKVNKFKKRKKKKKTPSSAA